MRFSGWQQEIAEKLEWRGNLSDWQVGREPGWKARGDNTFKRDEAAEESGLWESYSVPPHLVESKSLEWSDYMPLTFRWSLDGLTLNNEWIRERAVERRFDKSGSSFPFLRGSCPYCRQPTQPLSFERTAAGQQRISDLPDFYEEGGIEWCPECAYWRLHHQRAAYLGRGGHLFGYEGWESKLQSFEEGLPEGLSPAFAQYLRRHPSALRRLSPTRMERLVTDIFKANYGYADVMHVGGPGDGGIDVLFVESETKRWLVQVKRRSSARKSEGVATIRSLLGAMVLEGTLRGIVVSSANRFTAPAIEAQQGAARQGFLIDLVDKGKLLRMLKPALPDRPWRKHTEGISPALTCHLTASMPGTRQLELL